MWKGLSSCLLCWGHPMKITRNELFRDRMLRVRMTVENWFIFHIYNFSIVNWVVYSVIQVYKIRWKAECPFVVRRRSASVFVSFSNSYKKLSVVFCWWALSVSSGGRFLFVLIWSLRNTRLPSNATSCSTRWKLPSIYRHVSFRRLYTTLKDLWVKMWWNL